MNDWIIEKNEKKKKKKKYMFLVIIQYLKVYLLKNFLKIFS